jgi:hypothetical protein
VKIFFFLLNAAKKVYGIEMTYCKLKSISQLQGRPVITSKQALPGAEFKSLVFFNPLAIFISLTTNMLHSSFQSVERYKKLLRSADKCG